MTTTNTQPCVALGRHLSTQRHARGECPTAQASLISDLASLLRSTYDEKGWAWAVAEIEEREVCGLPYLSIPTGHAEAVEVDPDPEYPGMVTVTARAWSADGGLNSERVLATVVTEPFAVDVIWRTVRWVIDQHPPEGWDEPDEHVCDEGCDPGNCETQHHEVFGIPDCGE